MPRRLKTAPLIKSTQAPIVLLRSQSVAVTRDAQSPVATVQLTRASRRNALDHDTLVEIEAAFEALQGRPDVRVVILSGAGKSFCAGHDLSSSADGGGNVDANGSSEANANSAANSGSGDKGWPLQAQRHRMRQGARTIRAIQRADAVTAATELDDQLCTVVRGSAGGGSEGKSASSCCEII